MNAATREAKVKFPKCGHPFTVREKLGQEAENMLDALGKRVDNMAKNLDDVLEKLFPSKKS